MLEFLKSSAVRNVIEAHCAGECVGFIMRMHTCRDLWGLYWNGTDTPFAITDLRRAQDYFRESWTQRKPALWDTVKSVASEPLAF